MKNPRKLLHGIISPASIHSESLTPTYRTMTEKKRYYVPRSATLEERFFAGVPQQPDENGCWIWTRGKQFTGYGMFSGLRINGKQKHYKAHRFAWEVWNWQSIPDGLVVRHRPVICHNRACVNPRHLVLGTKEDNERDKILDGTDSKGERNGNAKLTADDVIEIRRLYATGDHLYREIAEKFNVSHQQISLIINRKLWKHL